MFLNWLTVNSKFKKKNCSQYFKGVVRIKLCSLINQQNITFSSNGIKFQFIRVKQSVSLILKKFVLSTMSNDQIFVAILLVFAAFLFFI